MRDVDVHCIRLDADPDGCAALLSPEERGRAARFRFDRDRAHFSVCRGTLRRLLGEALSLAPERIEFSYGAHGKPETAGINFNVSHSGGFALIAISKRRVVGVDIERMDRSFADDRIPERFFSPGEVLALRALPQGDQLEAFFRIWTRKEAYLKACGLGLSLALDSFDVSLGCSAAFLRGVQGWEIEAVPAPPGYAAALVGSLE